MPSETKQLTDFIRPWHIAAAAAVMFLLPYLLGLGHPMAGSIGHDEDVSTVDSNASTPEKHHLRASSSVPTATSPRPPQIEAGPEPPELPTPAPATWPYQAGDDPHGTATMQSVGTTLRVRVEAVRAHQATLIATIVLANYGPHRVDADLLVVTVPRSRGGTVTCQPWQPDLADIGPPQIAVPPGLRVVFEVQCHEPPPPSVALTIRTFADAGQTATFVMPVQ